MRLTTLAWLMACTPPGVALQASPLLAESSLAPPTHPTFDVDVGAVCPGQTATVTMTDAPASSSVTLVTAGGLGNGACVGGVCAAIGPRLSVVGTTRTDAWGEGTLLVPIPAGAQPGAGVWIQAADIAAAEVSPPRFVVVSHPEDPECDTRGPARGYQLAWGGISPSDPEGMPGTARFEPHHLDRLFAHADMQVISGFHGGWELDDSWRDAVVLRAMEGIDLSTTALHEVSTERTLCFYINSSFVVTGTRNKEPWLSNFDEDWLLYDDAGVPITARNSINQYGDHRQSDYRDFFLDIARRYLLPFDDPDDGLGNPVNSPFNCLAMDSHNHIGGADPVTNALDWDYWHSDVDWADPESAIDDWNLGLDTLRADLLTLGRTETGLGTDFTLLFNGIAEKDFRINRSLGFFDHADAGMNEDFCVDYQTLARAEELLASGATAEDRFCATRGYRSKELVLDDWAIMDSTDPADTTSPLAGKTVLWQSNYRLDDEPTTSCTGEVNDGPAIPTYADQVSFCHAEFLMGYRPGEHWFGNGRYRLGSLAYRAWAVAETLHDDSSTPELGAPLGARTEPAPGLFRREFERGTIWVNFDTPQTITLPPGSVVFAASRASHGSGHASLGRYGALITTR